MNSNGQLIFDPQTGKLIKHPVSGKLVYAVDYVPPWPYPQYFTVPLLSAPAATGQGHLLRWHDYQFTPPKYGDYSFLPAEASATFVFGAHTGTVSWDQGNTVLISVFGPNDWSFASSAITIRRVPLPGLIWFDNTTGAEVPPYSPNSGGWDCEGAPPSDWGESLGVYQLFTTPYVPGEVSVGGWTAMAPPLVL
jgi:hypothetical protein